jgi:hypothetical protein
MESMQFERAEFSAASAMACGNCQAALLGSYYQMNSASVCESCANGLKQMIAGQGSKLGRFAKAVLLGTGAAIAGGAAYGAITGLTGYNLALVAIGVGMFVGNAVRKGSGGRGGWRYQVLAALLTYLAIGGSLIPDAITEFRKGLHSVDGASEHLSDFSATHTTDSATAAPLTLAEDAAAASTEEVPPAVTGIIAGYVFIVGFVMVYGPLAVGFESPISLLIFGFGIWQAWTANRKLQLEISGPHRITGAQPPDLPAYGHPPQLPA